MAGILQKSPLWFYDELTFSDMSSVEISMLPLNTDKEKEPVTSSLGKFEE